MGRPPFRALQASIIVSYMYVEDGDLNSMGFSKFFFMPSHVMETRRANDYSSDSNIG